MRDWGPCAIFSIWQSTDNQTWSILLSFSFLTEWLMKMPNAASCIWWGWSVFRVNITQLSPITPNLRNGCFLMMPLWRRFGRLLISLFAVLAVCYVFLHRSFPLTRLDPNGRMSPQNASGDISSRFFYSTPILRGVQCLMKMHQDKLPCVLATKPM